MRFLSDPATVCSAGMTLVVSVMLSIFAGMTLVATVLHVTSQQTIHPGQKLLTGVNGEPKAVDTLSADNVSLYTAV